MNLLDLIIKIRADDQASGQISGISAGAIAKGNVMADAFTAVAGKIADVAGAVTDLGKQALDMYAEYEQLAGGVETLFGETAGQAMENAQNAFKTAGLSANEYMDQVNSFSASLRQALGDEHAWQLANYADQAVVDMSDNANKMGTDMQRIQDAYQGFAKQNFTMLDNLKLGYGGTKSEMERLLRDAEQLEGLEIGSYSIDNFADIISAIHTIQEEMGIAGTTQEEAAHTIQGSIAMAKSAWANFLTELGKDDGDVGARIDDLITSIFGDGSEENPGVIGNIAPRIVTIVSNIIDAIPQVVEAVGPAMEQIQAKFQEFVDTHQEEIAAMSETLWNGLVTALGVVAQGALTALGQLLGNLITTFPQWAPKLLEAAVMLFVNILQGIINVTVDVLNGIANLIGQAVGKVGEFAGQFVEAGANLIRGLIDGIVGGASGLVNSVMNTVGGAVEAVKNFLGIHSPSKLFAGIGENTMLGLAEGIEGAAGKAYDAMRGAVDRLSMDPQVSMKALPSQYSQGKPMVNINVYVDGRAYEDYNALGTGIGRAVAFEVKARGLA